MKTTLTLLALCLLAAFNTAGPNATHEGVQHDAHVQDYHAVHHDAHVVDYYAAMSEAPASVAFLAPADGETVDGAFAVEVAAPTDATVRLYLDDTLVGQRDAAPYRFLLSLDGSAARRLRAVAQTHDDVASATVQVCATSSLAPGEALAMH